METLESRIVPSSLISFPTLKSATWTDVDGDIITMTVTKGSLDNLIFDTIESGSGLQVLGIDLTDSVFNGTSIDVTAKRHLGINGYEGDGLVDIGYINANGNNLNTVNVNGDLGRIDAINATSIKILSLGMLGDDSLPSGVSLYSEISKLGTLSIKGGLYGSISADSINTVSIGNIYGSDDDTGSLHVSGKITTLSVRGSIYGGYGNNSGTIDAGSLGIITVGSLIGGVNNDLINDNTGTIKTLGNITSLAIGNIYGGTNANSALIEVANIGNIKVKGGVYGYNGDNNAGIVVNGNVNSISIQNDVRGGAGDNSGFLTITGNASNIKLGTLLGGTGNNSGVIKTNSASLLTMAGLIGGDASNSGILNLGKVTKLVINGDIKGGNLSSDANSNIINSGLIKATSIANFIITGSIQSGLDFNDIYDLKNTAAIRVDGNIGSIVVKGGLFGNLNSRVLITAVGEISNVGLKAINKATFGDVQFSDILAGYNSNELVELAEANPDAQIGSIVVNNDFIASNIVAGAKYSNNFGDGNDLKSSGLDDVSIVSKISSIIIKGQIYGTNEQNDHFGFVAQNIVSFKFGNITNLLVPAMNTLSLIPGASNDTIGLRYNLGSSLDVRVFEIN